MLPSPSRAPSALSDMTQYWARRRKLIGDQTLSDSELRSDGAGSSLCPRTLRASKLAGSRRYLATSSTIASNRQTNVQVNKLITYCLLGLMLALTLTAQPTMAKPSRDMYVDNGKPWIEEQFDHVIFRSQICQKKTTDDLARQLRLAEGAKDTLGDIAESKRNFGYQQDDPGSAPPTDGDDPDSENNHRLVENIERDMYIYDNKDSKVLEEEIVVDKRTWLPRKKVLKRGLARKGRKKSNRNKLEKGVDNDEDVGGVPSSPEYPYMRRRRRSIEDPEPPVQESSRALRENANLNDFTKEDNLDRVANEHENMDKKSGNLFLKLMDKGNSRSMRRQLKKQFRQNSRLLEKTPPWQCTYKSRQTEIQGAFPPSYMDGTCEKSKCFYNLYTCEAQKIAMKLLRRDPRRCNPLPSLTNATIYEERWKIITMQATIGCNCVNVEKQSRSGG